MIKSILIVDDEPLILSGLSRVLQVFCDFDGEIRTVINGRDAIIETSLCFYNICFLDLKLPDINGIDVMKEINETSPESDIAIISACFINDDMQKGIEENASRIIAKPFLIPEIEVFVKHAFEGDGDFYRDQESYGKGFRNWKRQFKRKPLMKTIRYYISEFGLMEFMGGIIDISYAGMGLQTYCPLERGKMLRFNKGLAHRAGVVKWSTKLGENNYRVGINFIEDVI